MNRLINITLTIIWGLWFGGLVMLLISVKSLFHTFAAYHETAGEAASGILREFNQYRVSLAAVALLLTAAWWLHERSRAKITIFIFLTCGALAAFASTTYFAPKIEQLRIDNLTHTMEFARLHGLSMGVYLIETIFVFLAGIILPNTNKR